MALPNPSWTRLLKILYLQAMAKRQRELDGVEPPVTPPTP